MLILLDYLISIYTGGLFQNGEKKVTTQEKGTGFVYIGKVISYLDVN